LLEKNLNTWPEAISNQELWSNTGQEEIKVEINRKWKWTEHMLAKGKGAVDRNTLDWNH
jgi:hypothetical protein